METYKLVYTPQFEDKIQYSAEFIRIDYAFLEMKILWRLKL